MIRLIFLLAAFCLPLAACDEPQEVSIPAPAEIGSEASGHICGMLLKDHAGPKGQIHLVGRSEPLWFTSVRDTIAFTRMPDQQRNIRAIYVNDMGRAADWATPGPGIWVDAKKAVFVVGSEMRGGMGAPEAVPFADTAAAEHFIGQHGGRILELAKVPDAYVIGPPDEGAMPQMTMDTHRSTREARETKKHATH